MNQCISLRINLSHPDVACFNFIVFEIQLIVGLKIATNTITFGTEFLVSLETQISLQLVSFEIKVVTLFATTFSKINKETKSIIFLAMNFS